MKVLIVEDEKRLAQALGQIMEEQKYSVDIVYDGDPWVRKTARYARRCFSAAGSIRSGL